MESTFRLGKLAKAAAFVLDETAAAPANRLDKLRAVLWWLKGEMAGGATDCCGCCCEADDEDDDDDMLPPLPPLLPVLRN